MPPPHDPVGYLPVAVVASARGLLGPSRRHGVESSDIPATRAELNVHDAHRRRSNSAVELADRVIGFEDHGGEAHEGPLTIQEQAVPTASVWPVLGAAGILLLILGFINGPWLRVPALMIALYVVLGWLTQLTR